MRNGTIRLCAEGPAASSCAGLGPTAPGVVQVRIGGATGGATRTWTVGVDQGECPFETGPLGAAFEVRWASAGVGRVRLVVEG